MKVPPIHQNNILFANLFVGFDSFDDISPVVASSPEKRVERRTEVGAAPRQLYVDKFILYFLVRLTLEFSSF